MINENNLINNTSNEYCINSSTITKATTTTTTIISTTNSTNILNKMSLSNIIQTDELVITTTINGNGNNITTSPSSNKLMTNYDISNKENLNK
jgi:hypothetical protein